MPLTVSLVGGANIPNRLETRRPMPDSMPWPCCRARDASRPDESQLTLSRWFPQEDTTKLPPCRTDTRSGEGGGGWAQ